MTAVALLVSVGIFAGMVLYTVLVLRTYQWRLLTGESLSVKKEIRTVSMFIDRPCDRNADGYVFGTNNVPDMAIPR